MAKLCMFLIQNYAMKSFCFKLPRFIKVGDIKRHFNVTAENFPTSVRIHSVKMFFMNETALANLDNYFPISSVDFAIN